MGDERMMTTAEVAEYLAIPTATIARWRYVGKGPPAAKIGKHLRFDRQDLLEWVAEQKIDRSETPGHFR